MDIDEQGEPPASNMNLQGSKKTDSNISTLSDGSDIQQSQSSSPRRVHSSIYSEQDQDQEQEQETVSDGDKLDPQCRSLSMDSAYGTLSPESLLRELQPQPGQSEGEETEEEEGGERVEQEEVELVEVEEEEEEEQEEEEEEEDSASLGSQLSVVQSSKPRRRPHVQSRLHCLQRPATLSLSRSEDNLLQRLHGKTPISHSHSLSPKAKDQSKLCDMDMSSLPHSKSLSELGLNCLELFSSDLDRPDDCVIISAPSDELCSTHRRAEAGHTHDEAPAGPYEGNEMAPSACVERKCESTAASDSGDVSLKKRKSPAPQHKKLTLAQLYRIRTTLVLNSTLTAS